MNSLPDFIIIGAMKCATSTLHEQLAAQGGFCMSRPKEPCYFSDDQVYARGEGWYRGLFAGANPSDLCGESSTHYTKLPTYPRTVERMVRLVPEVKLIYVMRHPIDRLVSHYVHEWTERTIDCPIDQAVFRHPRLIDYGRYAMQLGPYFRVFGRECVLPVFQERLAVAGQEELEGVCAFLGRAGPVHWARDRSSNNVSAQRLRKSPIRDALVNLPWVKQVRRGLIPQSVRNRVKRFWTLDKPRLSDVVRAELEAEFDQDLQHLGQWLGHPITCRTYRSAVLERPLSWTAAPGVLSPP